MFQSTCKGPTNKLVPKRFCHLERLTFSVDIHSIHRLNSGKVIQIVALLIPVEVRTEGQFDTENVRAPNTLGYNISVKVARLFHRRSFTFVSVERVNTVKRVS